VYDRGTTYVRKELSLSTGSNRPRCALCNFSNESCTSLYTDCAYVAYDFIRTEVTLFKGNTVEE